MDNSTIVLYGISIILLFVSIIKDKQKTKKAVYKGWIAFLNLIPILVPLFLVVGVVLSVLTPQLIKQMLGEESGVFGVLTGMIIGAVAFMPPFVTFPLGAELLSNGAGYPQVAAFMTTLMAVGLVYWAAETKYFGQKAVALRNSLAFIASGIVAVVVWGVI